MRYRAQNEAASIDETAGPEDESELETDENKEVAENKVGPVRC
jgi:hypothetical protein